MIPQIAANTMSIFVNVYLTDKGQINYKSMMKSCTRIIYCV